MVDDYPAKFGCYKHCDSRDIIFLVCQIISQEHVTEGSCEFIGGNS